LEQIKKRPFIIAIDGYSSCGKSTLAKQLAKELDFVFIDTGAMYRAVTLYFLQNDIDIQDEEQLESALKKIQITFKNLEGQNVTFLNGQNIEQEIRSLKVSSLVSEVAALSPVRKKMVSLQRQVSDKNGIVMDGRDIGTVVFPEADLKLFITADPIVRAQRRYNELVTSNQNADLHDVISNLQHRDHIDTTRMDSPLIQAKDAILLDNTDLTVQEQFDFALQLIHQRQ